MDRGTLGFQVEFEDGTMVEKTFNDIKKTVALNNFIGERELVYIIYSIRERLVMS
jgi:hypothetical protein